MKKLYQNNIDRIILNLKRSNENMPDTHFKMEAINSILTLVMPNCYVAQVDLKDTCCFVSILPEQQYLRDRTLSM